MPSLSSHEDLILFRSRKNHSFIVFSDHRFVLDFMDFSITKFQENVGFAYASFNLSTEFGCTRAPCFCFFKGDDIISQENPPVHAIKFLTWINRLVTPTVRHIRTSIEVKELLSSKVPTVFLIGDQSIPNDLPQDVRVNFVPQAVFKDMGIDISAGTYVYRPNDRELLPMDRPFKDLIRTSIRSSFGASKPYSAFFFTDDSNMDKAHAGVMLMNRLADKYEQFSFSILNTQIHEDIINRGSLKIVKAPFLVVFESNNISNNRWVVHNSEWSDDGYFFSLFDNISSKIQPYTLISKPEPVGQELLTFKELVADSFVERVTDPRYDVFVVFTAAWCHHCNSFKPILNETSTSLKDHPVRFYWMDGTENETPSIVPDFPGFPTMFLWPANNKSNPVQYDEERTSGGILKFINQYATHKVGEQ